MKKILITGFSGFVSSYFLEHLSSSKESVSILGLDLFHPQFPVDRYRDIECRFEAINLLHKEKVDNLIFQFQPQYILHLASYSSVAFSWRNPIESFRNNTNIFLNLVDTVRDLGIECRLLSIGSSEEYGNVPEKSIPITEELETRPVSPYAVARVSQEMLSRVYVDGYGMDIVMTRSFNHIGPQQKELFVVPSFVKQMVEMKKRGLTRGVLHTGDVSIVRDFLDVRDVVSAYSALLLHGKRGEIYNVCSGIGRSLRQVVDLIAEKLSLEIEIQEDPKMIRPNDNNIVVGSNEKIKKTTGWMNDIPFEKSIDDIIAHWNTIE
ncbi:MAG TPA: GDP-mannose 4,6-dehydratase [Spirochaetota bacterium]|nr:GDP-mannose 4,6-dehydratase [Spirochaetota bacterium]